jgi:hypothetical protein
MLVVMAGFLVCQLVRLTRWYKTAAYLAILILVAGLTLLFCLALAGQSRPPLPRYPVDEPPRTGLVSVCPIWYIGAMERAGPDAVALG